MHMLKITPAHLLGEIEPEQIRAPHPNASPDEKRAYLDMMKNVGAARAMSEMEYQRTRAAIINRPALLAMQEKLKDHFVVEVDQNGKAHFHRLSADRTPIVGIFPTWKEGGAFFQPIKGTGLARMLAMRPGTTGTLTWGGQNLLNRFAIINELDIVPVGFIVDPAIGIDVAGNWIDYNPVSSPQTLFLDQVADANDAPRMLPKDSVLSAPLARYLRTSIATNRSRGSEDLPLGVVDPVKGFTIDLSNLHPTLTVAFTATASVD